MSSSAVTRWTSPGRKRNASPARDLDVLELAADLAELEACAALVHEPGLVLALVVLEAQRLAGADEEQLADVRAPPRPR